MDDEVPNYFEDPHKECLDEIQKRAKKVIREIGDLQADVFAWACAWLGQYEEVNENPEMPSVPKEDIKLRHVIQNEAVLLMILKELRGLRADVQKGLDKLS